MSEKQKFQEVIREIRNDLDFLVKELTPSLGNRFDALTEVDRELKDWIYDVFLDKWYETHAKINNKQNNHPKE